MADPWQSLDFHYDYVREKLRIDDTCFLIELQNRGLLDSDDIEEVQREDKTRKEQLKYFIDHLRRNPEPRFSEFIEVLKSHKQEHVAKRLSECPNNLSRRHDLVQTPLHRQAWLLVGCLYVKLTEYLTVLVVVLILLITCFDMDIIIGPY